MKTEYSKEDRVILGALRGECGSGFVDELIRPQPDWQQVLDDAVFEGVFYPFYENFSLLDKKFNILPDGIREKFRQTYYLHVSKGAVAARRMEKTLDEIDRLGIKALLVKGMATDLFIYDGFVRPRLDMDIVIRDEDMPAVETALSGLGYLLERPEKDYPIPEYLNSKLFAQSAGDLEALHIHRHLMNNMFLTLGDGLRMDMERVWQETETFKGYTNIAGLKPELNIVYLCEHGLRHDFDQLVYLYEIGRLMEFYKGRLDWNKLTGLAREFGLERMAYYGLFFVKEVLCRDVPAEALDALRPEDITMGEKAFIGKVLGRERDRYMSYPVYLARQKGPAGKARFVFRTIIPPGFGFSACLKRVRSAVSIFSHSAGR